MKKCECGKELKRVSSDTFKACQYCMLREFNIGYELAITDMKIQGGKIYEQKSKKENLYMEI